MRKQVVFGANDGVILAKANEQENFSAYVKGLISEDIKSNQVERKYVAESRGKPKLYIEKK